jgi:hypothetical protein
MAGASTAGHSPGFVSFAPLSTAIPKVLSGQHPISANLPPAMSRYLFSLKACLLLLLVSASTHVLAQTLPNPGFENWVGVGTACEEPEAWNSPNGGLALFGLCNVTRETGNVHSGSASVKMETVLVPLISINAPGAVSNGILVVDPSDPFNSTVQGGSPIWGMPDALTGFYDYAPLGGDSLTIRVRLFDITGDDTTQIAEAEFIDNSTTGGYTSFNLPITYTMTEDAELAEVLVRSTRNSMAATVGTVLYIDDFAFTGIASIDDAAAGISSTWYPNPASTELRFRHVWQVPVQAELVDLHGRVVARTTAFGEDGRLDCSALPSGPYLYRVLDADHGRLLDRGHVRVLR